MVQINWTKQAQNDLKNIADFIANDSVRFARIQINKIRNRTKILKEDPLIGRIVPEFKDKTIRELIEKNRIVYRIESSSRVDILLILHSRKNINEYYNLFNNKPLNVNEKSYLAWHKKELETTEKDFKNGKENLIDWETAKRKLKNDITYPL